MFYFGFKELGQKRKPKDPLHENWNHKDPLHVSGARTGNARIRCMLLEPEPEMQGSKSCYWSQNRKQKDLIHVVCTRAGNARIRNMLLEPEPEMQGSTSCLWSQNQNARIQFILLEPEPETQGSLSCCWSQNRKRKDSLHVAWCQNRKRKDLHHVSGARTGTKSSRLQIHFKLMSPSLRKIKSYKKFGYLIDPCVKLRSFKVNIKLLK